MAHNSQIAALNGMGGFGGFLGSLQILLHFALMGDILKSGHHALAAGKFHLSG